MIHTNDSTSCLPLLRNASAVLLWCMAAGCGKPAPPPQAKPEPKQAAVQPAPATQAVAAVPAPPAPAVPTNTPPPPKPKLELTSNIIAYVGTEPVLTEEFTKDIPEGTLDTMPDYLRRQYAARIDELIGYHLAGCAADRECFTNEPGYQRDIDAALRKVNLSYYFERHIQARATVTDQEVKEQYTLHADAYKVPATLRVRHILVEVKTGAYAAEVSNALEKAQGLRKRVLEGEKFEDVAASDSDCVTKSKGGDLGYRQRGQLEPVIEDTAFALHGTEISGVIRSRYGFHIVQVTDRMAERRRTFDEVKNEIRTELEQRREQQLYAGLLATLTNTYPVIRNEHVIQDLVRGGL